MASDRIIIPSPASPSCIYCGETVRKVRKGEHIIPDALGGVRTIKEVCGKCNNGVLSDLDRELCSASPIGIITSEILGNGIGQTWDVDHRDGNILLEGMPSWAERSMTLWPQMIVTHAGVQICGDYEEMLDVGYDGFQQTFVRHLRRAFARWRQTRKGIFFQPLNAPNDILQRYQYPPRFFARRRICEFGDKMTFVAGYETDADKRSLLGKLENWDSGSRFRKYQVGLGSELPAIRRYWDVAKILRALTKLGINLIYDTCDRTVVDPNSFREAAEFVLGRSQPSSRLAATSGFVWPTDLDAIHRADDGHSFRLTHDGKSWRLHSSFFGGRVCAAIQFPGPSNESWKTADISTPLASSDRDVTKEWTVKRHALLIPTQCHVEWAEPDRIIPSVEMINTNTTIDVRVIRKRKH